MLVPVPSLGGTLSDFTVEHNECYRIFVGGLLTSVCKVDLWLSVSMVNSLLPFLVLPLPTPAVPHLTSQSARTSPAWSRPAVSFHVSLDAFHNVLFWIFTSCSRDMVCRFCFCIALVKFGVNVRLDSGKELEIVPSLSAREVCRRLHCGRALRP